MPEHGILVIVNKQAAKKVIKKLDLFQKELFLDELCDPKTREPISVRNPILHEAFKEGNYLETFLKIFTHNG